MWDLRWDQSLTFFSLCSCSILLLFDRKLLQFFFCCRRTFFDSPLVIFCVCHGWFCFFFHCFVVAREPKRQKIRNWVNGKFEKFSTISLETKSSKMETQKITKGEWKKFPTMTTEELKKLTIRMGEELKIATTTEGKEMKVKLWYHLKIYKISL